jgi:hypothetical protein
VALIYIENERYPEKSDQFNHLSVVNRFAD